MDKKQKKQKKLGIPSLTDKPEKQAKLRKVPISELKRTGTHMFEMGLVETFDEAFKQVEKLLESKSCQEVMDDIQEMQKAQVIAERQRNAQIQEMQRIDEIAEEQEQEKIRGYLERDKMVMTHWFDTAKTHCQDLINIEPVPCSHENCDRSATKYLRIMVNRVPVFVFFCEEHAKQVDGYVKAYQTFRREQLVMKGLI